MEATLKSRQVDAVIVSISKLRFYFCGHLVHGPVWLFRAFPKSGSRQDWAGPQQEVSLQRTEASRLDIIFS